MSCHCDDPHKMVHAGDGGAVAGLARCDGVGAGIADLHCLGSFSKEVQDPVAGVQFHHGFQYNDRK